MASMNTDPASAQHRLRRILFAVWRSPLARSTDRTEAALLLILVTLWLVVLPVVAVLMSVVWSGISATADDQRQSRTMTTAHLLADVPDYYSTTEYDAAIKPTAPASAQWNTPDGRLHSGEVEAPVGVHSGEPQTIWIDKAGDVTEPPIDKGTTAAVTALVAMGFWLTWGALLAGTWLAVRCRLDKGRILEWDRQWTTFEPIWSGREPHR